MTAPCPSSVTVVPSVVTSIARAFTRSSAPLRVDLRGEASLFQRLAHTRGRDRGLLQANRGSRFPGRCCINLRRVVLGRRLEPSTGPVAEQEKRGRYDDSATRTSRTSPRNIRTSTSAGCGPCASIDVQDIGQFECVGIVGIVRECVGIVGIVGMVGARREHGRMAPRSLRPLRPLDPYLAVINLWVCAAGVSAMTAHAVPAAEMNWSRP